MSDPVNVSDHNQVRWIELRRPESRNALTSCGESLLDSRVVREQHIVVEVRLQLPAVGRVRLGDVDEYHRGTIPVTPIHGLDVAGPATKWRSGEAAEDDDERPGGDERP